jgi:hypothetical protein
MLITTARTIGSHENTPKITINGTRKRRVLRPSRLTSGRPRRRVEERRFLIMGAHLGPGGGPGPR